RSWTHSASATSSTVRQHLLVHHAISSHLFGPGTAPGDVSSPHRLQAGRGPSHERIRDRLCQIACGTWLNEPRARRAVAVREDFSQGREVRGDHRPTECQGLDRLLWCHQARYCEISPRDDYGVECFDPPSRTVARNPAREVDAV